MISYTQREDLHCNLVKRNIFLGLFWSINNTSYCSTPVRTLKNMFLTDSLPSLSGDSGIMHSARVLFTLAEAYPSAPRYSPHSIISPSWITNEHQMQTFIFLLLLLKNAFSQGWMLMSHPRLASQSVL